MKSYAVFLTPDAIQDLHEIYDFIAEESGLPEIAWRYIETLRERCHTLQNAPVRGHPRDDIRPRLRIMGLAKNAVAAFEVDEKKYTVTVLNIFHDGRDYETLMSRPGQVDRQSGKQLDEPSFNKPSSVRYINLPDRSHPWPLPMFP